MNHALYVAHDADQPFEVEKVSQHLAYLFAQECGFRPLPWMPRRMASFLSRGFDPALIEEAIRRTSFAPRPSWAYLNAILENAAAAKTFDLEEFLSASIARRTMEPAPEIPAQDFKFLNEYYGGVSIDY